MCMAVLTRRLQILLDEERMQRLERRAQRSGTSVAALIRDAIDLAFPDEERRRAAGRRLLEAPPMPVEDWETMKRVERDSLFGAEQ